MGNHKELTKLADAVAAQVTGELGEYGKEVSILAQRAVAQQVLLLSEKLAGHDTTLGEAALAATYQNLAVGSSAKTAKATNAAFKKLVTAAVATVFEAAGLPTAAKAVKPKSDPDE